MHRMDAGSSGRVSRIRVHVVDTFFSRETLRPCSVKVYVVIGLVFVCDVLVSRVHRYGAFCCPVVAARLVAANASKYAFNASRVIRAPLRLSVSTVSLKLSHFVSRQSSVTSRPCGSAITSCGLSFWSSPPRAEALDVRGTWWMEQKLVFVGDQLRCHVVQFLMHHSPRTQSVLHIVCLSVGPSPSLKFRRHEGIGPCVQTVCELYVALLPLCGIKLM